MWFISRYSAIITDMSAIGKKRSEIVAHIIEEIFKNMNDDDDDDDDEDDDEDEGEGDDNTENTVKEEEEEDEDEKEKVSSYISTLKAAAKLYDTITQTTEIQIISARSIYTLLNSDTIK